MTGSAQCPSSEEKKGKRLIALAWIERLTVSKQLWAAMYRVRLVTSGRGIGGAMK